MFNFTICGDVNIVARGMTGILSLTGMKINGQERNDDVNSTRIMVDDEDKKDDLIVGEYGYMGTNDRCHRCEVITTKKHIDYIPYFEQKENRTKHLQSILLG